MQVRVYVSPEPLVVQVGVPIKCGLAASTVVVKEEDSASPTAAIAIIVYVTLIFVFCMSIWLV